MFVDKEALLKVMGLFTWTYGKDWFIETDIGNFHWSDPDYGDGDNTIRLFNGTWDQFKEHIGVGGGRYKGQHQIQQYCGPDFTLVIPQEN